MKKVHRVEYSSWYCESSDRAWKSVDEGFKISDAQHLIAKYFARGPCTLYGQTKKGNKAKRRYH